MYSIDVTVSASHTGPDGKMTPVSMVSFMQDCSILWMKSEPTFTQYLLDNQIFMVVTSRQMEIRRVPVYGEKVRVETRIYDCKPLLGYRNTTIYGEDGQIAVTCWAVGAWVSAIEAKAVRVPKEVIATLTYDEKINMEYGKRKIPIPEVEPFVVEKIATRRSDIDLNKHVNNTQYIRMAYDLTPEDFEIKGMRVEYKNQAKLGEGIYPLVYIEEDRIVVVLNDAEGKTYSVVEFS